VTGSPVSAALMLLEAGSGWCNLGTIGGGGALGGPRPPSHPQLAGTAKSESLGKSKIGLFMMSGLNEA